MRLQAGRSWLLDFISHSWVHMLTLFLMIMCTILVWCFWKSTRNSWIWIKSRDRLFLVWSWDSSGILLHILMAAAVSVVVIHWGLILSDVFCSRSVCVRQIGSTVWSIICMTVCSMVRTVFIIILISSMHCTFPGTTLVMLGLTSRTSFIDCAAWSLFLLKHASTHMEIRLVDTKVVLDRGLHPVLRCGLPWLFHILPIDCRGIWELLLVMVVICRLIEFHWIFHLLGLCRTFWLIQMVRMRRPLINARPACMTISKLFRTMSTRCLLLVWIDITAWSMQLILLIRVSLSLLMGHRMVWLSCSIYWRGWSIFRLAWGGRSTLRLSWMPSSMTISPRSALAILHLSFLHTWGLVGSRAFNIMYVLLESICYFSWMMLLFSLRRLLLSNLVGWLVTRILMGDVRFGRSFWRRHHARVRSILVSALGLMFAWIGVLMDYTWRLSISLWIMYLTGRLCTWIRVWTYHFIVGLSILALCCNTRCHMSCLRRSSFDFICR